MVAKPSLSSIKALRNSNLSLEQTAIHTLPRTEPVLNSNLAMDPAGVAAHCATSPLRSPRATANLRTSTVNSASQTSYTTCSSCTYKHAGLHRCSSYVSASHSMLCVAEVGFRRATTKPEQGCGVTLMQAHNHKACTIGWLVKNCLNGCSLFIAQHSGLGG